MTKGLTAEQYEWLLSVLSIAKDEMLTNDKAKAYCCEVSAILREQYLELKK